MTIVYQILLIVFVLAILFGILGIGYYAGRKREFDIRQMVCNSVKKQIPYQSGDWLNGAIYVISRLNEMDEADDQ